MWKFSAVYTNGLYWTSVEQDVVFKITFLIRSVVLKLWGGPHCKCTDNHL